MVDAARADPAIGAAALLPPPRAQPAAQGRQHRRLGRALGRRLSVHAGARRRQPDGGATPSSSSPAAWRPTTTLGILQTSPHLIGGETPLARVQQFASRVYGPVLTRGLRAWFGNAGNYWGHNAIIRTRAFAECGGLPELPGKPPFGGLILSHDFVEAALRPPRRLGGAHGRRPRRQLRARAAEPDRARRPRPPLVPGQPAAHRGCSAPPACTRSAGCTSFMGVMSYLSSPLWLLFLLAGMSLALHAYLVPPDYFLDRWSLFPDWPRIDPERAMALFGLCMLVLFAPKLLGTAAFLGDRAARGLRLRAALRPRHRDPALGARRPDHDAGADLARSCRSSPAATAAGTRRPATPTGCPGACSGASTPATCTPASCSRSPPRRSPGGCSPG